MNQKFPEIDGYQKEILNRLSRVYQKISDDPHHPFKISSLLYWSTETLNFWKLLILLHPTSTSLSGVIFQFLSLTRGIKLQCKVIFIKVREIVLCCIFQKRHSSKLSLKTYQPDILSYRQAKYWSLIPLVRLKNWKITPDKEVEVGWRRINIFQKFKISVDQYNKL